MVRETKKIKELKHHARRLSIKEGIYARASFSLGSNYVSPFAVAVNSSNFLVAFMSSLGGILGPLSQLYGSKLVGKISRKKTLTKYVFLESLVWILFLITAILFYKGIIVSVLPFLILLFFSLYIIFGNISYPSWFSWMGDIVDEEYRGRWFSKRLLIDGFIAGVLTIAGAIFLDFFKNENHLMFGFITLFGLAFVFRIFCVGIFKKQYEPKLKLKKTDYFSFWDFLKKAPQTNFGKFSILRTLLNFTTSISSALVVIYLLRYLNFNYLTYVVIILSGTVFAALLLGFWGKFSDSYGNYKVLKLTSFAIPLVPILWILNPSPIYLILVPSLINGISFVGFNLSSMNFIYDNVKIEKRGLAVSYHNMLVGIGVFLGAGLGAFLIEYLKFDFIEPIFAIFILSSILTFFVLVFGFSKMKEVRKTFRYRKGSRVFKDMIIKKGPSIISEEFHQIVSIKNYLAEK